ncbi:helix-turn-helix domain-containing protein [Spirosoma sp. KNUC1025]|uniref:helix-turn-helix domain-containing protein n=1 Tax=Spirosoma sp. KNUC1025 TaxID=2894082 RepID=UPI001E5A0A2B|nr:helix-turn-helix domain-containing protein [Spirosoma sp. KNUC1025]UFH57919.1 helix-turn-helix domain containing protein [Spirosoma sp. KNUC1025]
MDQLRLSPMQEHELTMRQMVQQIHLGKLNMDQAAVQFNVNRKTVRHWVDKVEKEGQTNPETASELSNLSSVQKKMAAPRSPSQSEDQNELRAKVHALEQELEVAKFKALYYSTIVKVAEQELGVDIEKKSVTKPSDSCS